MPEHFESQIPVPKDEKDRKFASPEERKVTERTYEDYLRYFALPENGLKGKQVLDVGSGLSTFAEVANTRLGKTGTNVVALDPIYALMGKGYKTFEKNVEKAGMNFRSVSGEAVDPKELYKRIKGFPNKVAGSHQQLPFRRESLDLVLASNSITQYHDREITRTALGEIAETLKQDGELRIQPADLRWDNNTQSLYVHTFEKPTPETLKEAKDLGLQIGPDRDVFAIFKELEEQGFTFYATLRVSRAGGMRRRGMQVNYSLILRRDGQIPNVEGLYQLHKLSFKESQDGYHVPSEEIPVKVGQSGKESGE